MLDFLRRHQVPISSGILLLVAAMLMSVNARRAERVNPLTRAALEVVAPLQLGVARVADRVRGVWHGYLDLVGARGEADALRERLRALEEEVARLGEVQAAHRRLEALLEFRESVAAPLVAARVIGWDASSRDRSITLDKGERHGVRQGAAVLVPEGVVGHVFRVSPRTSRVLLVADRHSGVDVIVQRTRVRGILQGRGDGCELKYVKRGADVEAGDRVVTSGLDGIFPKGVVVGEVVRVNYQEQGQFQSIVVDPGVDFARLEEVLVTTGVTPREPVT
jgi:rod shape-determining protein MreC